MEVPTTTSFEEVYPKDALDNQRKRWNNLLSSFDKEYGRKADFVSRSPGRVNIIGEVSLLFAGQTDEIHERRAQSFNADCKSCLRINFLGPRVLDEWNPFTFQEMRCKLMMKRLYLQTTISGSKTWLGCKHSRKGVLPRIWRETICHPPSYEP